MMVDNGDALSQGVGGALIDAGTARDMSLSSRGICRSIYRELPLTNGLVLFAGLWADQLLLCRWAITSPAR